ncbi:MAG: HD domain-containing phosphohydrolase [Capsulimonadaceae bacterium]|nr:HD domain-containing phosphohydrolase [Capsulimonadaceae bacterium]
MVHTKVLTDNGIDEGADAAVAVRPVALLGCDRGGAILSANAEAESLFERSATEIVGRPLSDLLTDFPLDACLSESVVNCAQMVVSANIHSSLTIPVDCTSVLMPEGSVASLLVTVRAPHSTALRMVTGGRSLEPSTDPDRTQLVPVVVKGGATKGAGANAPSAAGHAERIVGGIEDAVWVLAAESRHLIYLNPAGQRMFGRTNEELASGKASLQSVIHPDDLPRAVECIDFLMEYGAIEFECRFIRPDGVERWVVTKAHTVLGEDGRASYAQGVSSDITERKQRETHLARLNSQLQRRIERLSALHQIDSAISSSQDLGLTLNICLDHLAGHLQVDAARILIYDPYTQRLRFAAGFGFRHGGSRDIQRMIGTLQAGKAAMGRCTIFIPDISSRSEAFSSSAVLEQQAFVSYFALPLSIKGQVKGILEIFQRSTLNPDPEWTSFAETIAAQAATAIDNANVVDRLQENNNELCIAYDETIEGWSRALDLRDKETEGHSQRVTEMTLRLARALGTREIEILQVRRGALLHDIGKMGIPDQILLKPGPLNDEEWVIMRKHPVYAYEMLSPIDFLRPALDIPYCHHEKWDGTGYPRGLKGVQIPLSARIFAVVDVWDALRSDRPYRPGWAIERVVNHIRSLAGTHFDPQVVEVFMSRLEAGEFDDMIGPRSSAE